MSEIQAAVFPKCDECSTYADTDPIKILSDVEEAIRSLGGEGVEPDFCPAPYVCAAPDWAGRFCSSVTTVEAAALAAAAAEENAPKKRGRRPKPRPVDEAPVKKERAADAHWSDEEGTKRRRQISPTTCDRIYTDDEVEFMNALNLYKKLNDRPFPTCSETLEVLRRIGYVKMPPAHENDSDEPIFAAPLADGSASMCEEAAGLWTEDEVFVCEA